MKMTMQINKVAAFITQDLPTGRELLVFRHPTAGIQIPAGTVDPGESPETSVLREVQEEAGLNNVQIVLKLASFKQQLSADQYVLLQKAVLQEDKSNDANPLDFSVTRGMTVRLVDERGEKAQIVYSEYDYQEGELVIKETYIGWVPRKNLTNDVERHLFQLKTVGPVDNSWEVQADRRHIFRFYWVPIYENPGLVQGQNAWFDQIHEKLKL